MAELVGDGRGVLRVHPAAVHGALHDVPVHADGRPVRPHVFGVEGLPCSGRCRDAPPMGPDPRPAARPRNLDVLERHGVHIPVVVTRVGDPVRTVVVVGAEVHVGVGPLEGLHEIGPHSPGHLGVGLGEGPAGGGSVEDQLLHLRRRHMGFGGVGEEGREHQHALLPELLPGHGAGGGNPEEAIGKGERGWICCNPLEVDLGHANPFRRRRSHVLRRGSGRSSQGARRHERGRPGPNPRPNRNRRPNRNHRQNLRGDFRKSESPWLSIRGETGNCVPLRLLPALRVVRIKLGRSRTQCLL